MRKLLLTILLTICYTCEAQLANSLIKEEIPIVKDSQVIDTIHIIAESDSIFVKGKFYYEKKDFSTAITYFLKSDSVIHVHFGTNSPYLGYGKIWASSCYHKLGMDSIALRYSNYYDKQPIDKMLTHTSDSVVWVALKLIELGQIKNAAEKLLEAAKLEEQELGFNNYWYANTLSNCAGLFCEIGNFEKAIELGKDAVDIYKYTFGNEHPNYITCLKNLIEICIESGNYTMAIQYCKENLEIEKRIYGLHHPNYASCLSNLATSYAYSGNYSMAIQLYKEALEIVKRIYGTEHLEYATILSNLASNYGNLNNYIMAIQLGKEAVEIKKRILGTDNLDYALSLSNLAEDYHGIGNNVEAMVLGKKAMNIRKMVLGTEHPDYALSLICVADYYSAVGNYSEALLLGTEAMEVYKKVLGPVHPLYATSLFRLATYYCDLGNYAKALKFGTEAMEIRKETLGTEHPEYATSLGNLALYYLYLGNYAKAIQIGKDVAELYKKIFGTDSPHYAISLAFLARIYSELGNYSEAKRLGNMSLDIYQKGIITDNAVYANIVKNIANYNASLGNNTEALLLGKNAINILKKALGTEHPEYALLLCNQASYYSNIGNYTEAYDYMKRFLDYSQSYLLRAFGELSSNLRESVWTKKYSSFYICTFPRVVEKYKNKKSISELYNKTCLFAKGLLLNTDVEIRNLIHESGDSTLIAKYNHLSSNIGIFNKLIETPINKRYINVDSLNDVIQKQEMELAKESKNYGDYTYNLTISWEDVQKGIGDSDIAIEFMDFPIFNSDSTMYVALTLKKGYDSPHMVMLFEENQLKAVSEDVYYTQTDVSDLVWKPLEEELRGIRNIYFAPSGELHRIGIEYLPISKTENISDVYTLHRLSSTRQLAVIQDKTKGKNNIIYGGINYDEKPRAICYDSALTEGSVLRTAFNRANVDSLSLRNSFEYLEGSKKEADMIAEDMKQHHVSYIYYSGTDGSEESFKLLDGTKPKTMHIATHGFYFSKSEAEKTIFARPDMEMMTEGIQKISHPVEDKPMTRSGLLFSGCNRAFRHEQIPDCEEDGILTAQEISRLDLRGLDLVVLSACQTGLGDLISGEGVFGLQRGFKKAGAKTILMSLNKVDDEATQILMVEFYKNLMNGKSKHQSLKDSQKYLRQVENGKYDKPEYWASFILLDGIL